MLRDLDWLHAECTLPADAASLISVLESDTAFLASKRLIDYSLLVGLAHYCKEVPRDTTRPYCRHCCFVPSTPLLRAAGYRLSALLQPERTIPGSVTRLCTAACRPLLGIAHHC